MQSAWKRQQRPTLLLAVALLVIWALFIYWQGDITWDGFLRALGAIGRLDFAAIPAPFGSLFLDVLILLLGSAFWFIFLAHFVLPIQKAAEIADVVKAMARALLGLPPSAIYLRNGEMQAKGLSPPSERARIWLLDSASAAVLRNDTAFTRALGPGLSFVGEDERLAGALDLRIQRRSTGPLPGESPFDAKHASEDAPAYEARQTRRTATAGITRDGVEAVPRLQVEFRIAGRRHTGKSPFPFQAEFAWRAIANEGVSPQSPSDVRNRQVSWDWLPTQLAADLWREYLRKFNLRALFEESESANNGSNARSGLEAIQGLISQRLRSAIIEDRKGNQSSPEYQLLRNRGIQVLAVHIRELHIDSGRDELRLVNEWSEKWELQAIQQEYQSEQSLADLKVAGQRAAAAEFIHSVTDGINQRLEAIDGSTVSPPDANESLQLLVGGALRRAQKLSDLEQDVLGRIRLMKAWVSNEEEDAG